MKKINIKILIACLFSAASLFILDGQENKIEKIAIAADGKTMDSQVGDQGARSQWLLLFNEMGELKETLENPFYQERGGAGVRCAELLADKNITIFVAGNIGNKMADALEDFEIVFVSFTGTIEEAISNVLKKLDQFKPN